MSDIVFVTYDETNSADEVLNEMRALKAKHLIDLEDACVIVRDNDGGVHLKHAVNLASTGPNGTAGWGALSNTLYSYGISDNYIESLAEMLADGTSALLVLAQSTHADEMLPQLNSFGGTVMQTSLTPERDEHLRRALAGVRDV